MQLQRAVPASGTGRKKNEQLHKWSAWRRAGRGAGRAEHALATGPSTPAGAMQGVGGSFARAVPSVSRKLVPQACLWRHRTTLLSSFFRALV